MFFIKTADLIIKIDNKYDYIQTMCRDYIIAEKDFFDFEISVTDDEIKKEQTASFPDEYLESLAIYRKIAIKIQEYDGFLMHGVVSEFNNMGIIFLAKSGVGKTTHAMLWKKMLEDKFIIVNGDKPLIRYIDNEFLSYGTPWAGKEGIQTNKSCILKKVCFIERGEINQCKKIKSSEAVIKILEFIYVNNKKSQLKILELLNKLVNCCEFYIIKCNTDISAAKIAYEEIIK